MRVVSAGIFAMVANRWVTATCRGAGRRGGGAGGRWKKWYCDADVTQIFRPTSVQLRAEYSGALGS